MTIDQIKEKMCDEYCRMPHEACDQEELEELCKYCPLNDLMPLKPKRKKPEECRCWIDHPNNMRKNHCEAYECVGRSKYGKTICKLKRRV